MLEEEFERCKRHHASGRAVDIGNEDGGSNDYGCGGGNGDNAPPRPANPAEVAEVKVGPTTTYSIQAPPA